MGRMTSPAYNGTSNSCSKPPTSIDMYRWGAGLAPSVYTQYYGSKMVKISMDLQ
jgi:hypothetical protein